jgi:hypothetical protein
MNKNLPEQENVISITTKIVTQNKELPSIYRFITERSTGKKTRYAKLMAATLVSSLLIIGIVLECVALYHNLQTVNNLKMKRAGLMGEVMYLKNVASQYSNYRDIYFRLAELEYTLGNVNASNEYIKKTMALDPNFTAGRVLAAHIKATQR